jgi:hypothetical protein
VEIFCTAVQERGFARLDLAVYLGTNIPVVVASPVAFFVAVAVVVASPVAVVVAVAAVPSVPRREASHSLRYPSLIHGKYPTLCLEWALHMCSVTTQEPSVV